jgi:hypothetical protein
MATYAIPTMAPDLAFLLEDRLVDSSTQKHLCDAGFSTIGIFALMADTRTEVRTMLKAAPFGLDPEAAAIEADPTEKVRRRVAQARVIDAWEAAQVRVEERRKAEATQRASGLPHVLPVSVHIAFRRDFEAVYGRADDKAFPSDALIDKRFQDIEQGDLKAETLDQVITKEEQSDDVMGAVFDTDGTLRVKKGIQKVMLPGDAEALRRRIHILGITWTLAKLSHPARGWLQTASPDVWREHLDHVLGEEVYGFKITSSAGDRSSRSSWKTLLSYEFQLRKEAIRLVNFEGVDFKAAMVRARGSTELREKHFVTPCILDVVTMAAAAPAGQYRAEPYAYMSPWQQPPAGKGVGKGKAKGQGKGKGKGKGKDTRRGANNGATHGKTPDGKEICFAYNKGGCKLGAKCHRVHVCTKCFGQHPATACPVGAPAPH